MELSVFLAKLLGLYFLFAAFDLLLRKGEFEKAVKDFASSKGLLVFSGSISLLFGLAIAIAHPYLEWSYLGLITFIGYVLILRGFVRMVFPSAVQKRLSSIVHRGYKLVFLLILIIGMFLTYSGFVAN